MLSKTRDLIKMLNYQLLDLILLFKELIVQNILVLFIVCNLSTSTIFLYLVQSTLSSNLASILISAEENHPHSMLLPAPCCMVKWIF